MQTYSIDELNKLDKGTLISLLLSSQSQLETISRQLDVLTEQIRLMNQRTFGTKSEVTDVCDGQLTIFDTFNEAEALYSEVPEPVIDEVVVPSYTRSSKKKSKREENLKDLPTRIIQHTLSKEELDELFPNGYKELPVEVYKRLSVIPQTFIVDEHHVHTYVSKNNDGTISRAKRPLDLFRNSLATPILVAAIAHGKYGNHLPLDRQSRAYKETGVNIETNVMAGWIIKSAEEYLSLVTDRFHKELYSSPVIHADETPLKVIRDGRSANAKSYMWVYRTGKSPKEHPVVIYDYQLTRKSDHPRSFLKDFKGVCVTDGYQVYHTIESQLEDLTIAGCWVHAKRGFSEIVKSLGGEAAKGTIAYKAMFSISKIFHEDAKLDAYTSAKRKKERQRVIKPLVDEFFAWAKSIMSQNAATGATAKALQYCINQEKYLRVFLSNADVPMDNNRAEQAIRPFTIGRKNWVVTDTIAGAKASAIYYSIIETAKANNLRLVDYLEFLLTELCNHQKDNNLDFIEDLLPWNPTVQKRFSKDNPKDVNSVINV